MTYNNIFYDIAGIGFGLAYISAVTIVGFYFERYRAIAYCLAVSGIGVGTITFPPLLHFLEEYYSWKDTFLMTGAICLNLIICGALFRPVEDENKKAELIQNKGLYLHVFKNISYNIVCLHSILTWFGITLIYMHLPTYANSIGYNKHQVATLISIVGVANLIGRLVFGGLNSILITLSPMCLYTLGLAGAGITIILCPISNNYIWLASCSGGFGFLWAAFGPIYPEVMIDIIDLNLLSVAYGYSMFFMAIGTLSAGPISGKISYKFLAI